MNADSTQNLPVPILTLGAVLNNRYIIEAELGRGGVGVVYRARDERLVSRPVVVKVLLEESAKSAWLLNKFHHEIEALSRINHPGIVGVLDKGELPGHQPFIVMQFVNGVTLRSALSGEALTLHRAAGIVRQLGRALTAVHDHNVCHRDLKPENIMLQDEGEGEELVKVIDFGIAKVQNAVTGLNTSGSRLAGTPYYMAPEQLQHEAATPVSDIYALGVIAYEMLAGQHPFADFRRQERVTLHELYQRQRAGPPAWPRQLRPELPEGLDEIIQKALTLAPKARYQRARDLGDDLACVLWGQEPSNARQPQQQAPQRKLRVALLYKRRAQPDEHVLRVLEEHLKTNCEVFIDRRLNVGVEWAREIERQIRTADAVVPLLSAASAHSEMLAHEVEIAHEAAQQNGKPRLLPVRVNHEAPLPEPLGSILNPLQYAHWAGREDDERLRKAITMALMTPPRVAPKKLEAEGGAVPLDSEFYVERPTDQEFLSAVKRSDSVVLVKGARQMGKTSLLARGLHLARGMGARVVLTDFQKLNAEHLNSITALLQSLGGIIADQLDLDCYPEDIWDPRRGPSRNFERYLQREVFAKINGPLVWCLDEVDRLFSCPFASEVFGLFRSWHNDRALDPKAPWPRLTMAMAYATEAHLFITDPNQSPFNVGTRLTLEDFTPEQVAELNRRYGKPLRDEAEQERFYKLLSGHPYLVRRGLNELVSRGPTLDDFEQQASLDEGPFGDHLRRFLVILAQDSALCDVMRKLIQGHAQPSDNDFYRLRSAGLLSGHTAEEARPRCQLYRYYFKRHLL
jgi:hypothetical protein